MKKYLAVAAAVVLVIVTLAVQPRGCKRDTGPPELTTSVVEETVTTTEEKQADTTSTSQAGKTRTKFRVTVPQRTERNVPAADKDEEEYVPELVELVVIEFETVTEGEQVTIRSTEAEQRRTTNERDSVGVKIPLEEKSAYSPFIGVSIGAYFVPEGTGGPSTVRPGVEGAVRVTKGLYLNAGSRLWYSDKLEHGWIVGASVPLSRSVMLGLHYDWDTEALGVNLKYVGWLW